MSEERAYRILVSFDREKEQFVARIPELEVSASAAVRTEAVAAAEEALGQALAAATEGGGSAPEPADAYDGNGVLSLTLAGDVYKDLLFAARRNRISPEELATQLLVRSLAGLEGGRPRRAPMPRDEARAEGAEGDSQPPRRDDRGGGDRRGNDRRGNDRGNDRGPPRRREGYHTDLDDKANFLEYLRGLEKGPPGGGGRRR